MLVSLANNVKENTFEEALMDRTIPKKIVIFVGEMNVNA